MCAENIEQSIIHNKGAPKEEQPKVPARVCVYVRVGDWRYSAKSFKNEKENQKKSKSNDMKR